MCVRSSHPVELIHNILCKKEEADGDYDDGGDRRCAVFNIFLYFMVMTPQVHCGKKEPKSLEIILGVFTGHVAHVLSLRVWEQLTEEIFYS